MELPEQWTLRYCKTRGWFWVLFVSSLLLCFTTAAFSQSMPGAAGLVQQGAERYQTGDYRGAIAPWEAALEQYRQRNQPENQALVLENLARVHQQLGQTQRAIATWEAVIGLQRQLQNRSALGRGLTEQAQLYSSIGQPRNAILRLCGEPLTLLRQQNPALPLDCTPNSAIALARAVGDPALESAALGSLGNAYRLMGEQDWAIAIALTPSLQLAQSLDDPTYQILALASLGNAHLSRAQLNYRRSEFARQRQDPDAAARLQAAAQASDTIALRYFEQSQRLAQQQNNRLAILRSLLSAIPVHFRLNQRDRAGSALQQAAALRAELPRNRDQIYATLLLARLFQIDARNPQQTPASCATRLPAPEGETLLREAIATAQQLQDARAASFALGELGHVYECRQQYDTALNWTQQARWAADQDLAARDSLYLWEWQSGRIFRAQNDLSQAIAAYQRAVTTLESIRGDILTAARDVQFDFRDTVEPIYRDLVELQLRQVQQGSPSPDANRADNKPQPADLESTLAIIDALKLAELQNYFGNECVVITPRQRGLNSITDSAVAIFNTFILDDRTAIILQLPGGDEELLWLEQSRSQLQEQINQFRQELESYQRLDYDDTAARALYDQMIRPFVADLQRARVTTLVFVQDGIFRSVPMAALQDGDRFLIEQYAIATTPSLNLTDSEMFQRQDLRVLALGLTEAREVAGQTFAPLPNVNQELAGIAQVIPDSRKLVNQEFTRDRLEAELSRAVFPILHIATHGSFSNEPENTFIITGDGEKLSFSELDRLIRTITRNPEPLELLVLTACETATGDERSALGLAGVAVQAGARSALASLWLIDDAATAQIATEFYANLRQPGISRAAALQAAQLAFLRQQSEGGAFVHPGLWSALLLVGNWR